MPRAADAERPVAATLEEPLGHAVRMRGLVRSAALGRLPHALLFVGRVGIGKYLAARWLACGLLCTHDDVERRPCGHCAGCRQFVSGNHLDVYAIDDDAETIKIRKIRIDPTEPEAIEAERFLATRAAAGGWRVLLVRDAERMNSEAQNAMLKMLEEPGERVLWLLTSAKPQGLLPTVRSRCITVPLDPLALEECSRVLASHGLVGDEARELARWAGGSPGRALSLAARSAITLRTALGAAFVGAADPLETSRALMQIEGEFSGSTPLAQSRDRARTVLDFALAIAADAQRAAAGLRVEELVHGDLVAALGPGELDRRSAELGRKLDALLEARADIDKNLDPQSLLDRALLALAP
ncbi:MAG: DNA polymerase III subunit delta' [Planctomycetes bacterium]|nr:DNA polymerase III subunit delta' [Planctomycetota bacterium]